MVWPFKGLFRKTSVNTVSDMSKQPTPDMNWRLSGDAIQPRQTPFGFVGQNPFQVLIPPGGGRVIRTGISADVPLLIFPTRGHSDALPARDGKVMEGASWPVIINPGEEVCVLIKNESQHSPLSIDDREPVICIHPLLFRERAGVKEI